MIKQKWLYLLGYTQWRRFEKAIERAITSCKESENPPEYHFAGAGKMIGLGKGGQRDVDDYHLSAKCLACFTMQDTKGCTEVWAAMRSSYWWHLA